jgi:hypothetical protein
MGMDRWPSSKSFLILENIIMKYYLLCSAFLDMCAAHSQMSKVK